jgi:hypothetical protein
MPVLDAQALNEDPKGAAFLLGVLRSQACPKPVLSLIPRHKASKRSAERAALMRQRLHPLESNAETY